MGNEVFANNNEIACKSGDGKVIAAFPDVCLSPPSPPAGPVPIPYPNTSFSNDMQNGSKTVKIDGKEVMLKDKSFYKTSPLGDEAATRTFGGSVITHVITGKTYFVAWSMDVKFEGENVDRHIDLTTSNHASTPGSTPPNPNLEAMEWGALENDLNQCACCHEKPKHSTGDAMTFDDWYGLNDTSDGHPPAADGANLTPTAKGRKERVEAAKKRKADGCCKGKLFPAPPCNVYRKPVKKSEKRRIERKHSNNAARYRRKHGMMSSDEARINFPEMTTKEEWDNVAKINHLTPKNAGGCPGKSPDAEGNLQSYFDLCDKCQDDDDEFGRWGSLIPTIPG